MSTGSKRGEFDFGMGESGKSASATPADLARMGAKETKTALPSDVAVKSARPKRRAEQPRKQRESSSAPAPKLLVDERVMVRRKRLGIAAVLIVAALLSLFIDKGYGRFFDIGEVFTCYGIWFSQFFVGLTGSGDVAAYNDILAVHPDYLRIVPRIGITIMTILCGVALSVAGTLYQSAFRNPIASPTMLGVASAIQLGDVILVIVFSSAAASQLGWRFFICYICVILTLVVLFVVARLMTGRKRPLNIINLLLVATILTQLIGVIVTYASMYVFTYEEFEVFMRVSEGLNMNLSTMSWVTLIITFAIGLAPVVALRFRLNGLNFDDAQMRMLGINAARLRLVALICGTILVMGAQVQMGTVAMVSLVVPHASRMLFGAEFRKQFWGNILMGAALLLICSDIVGFVPFLGSFLPVSVVVNFAVLPFFVWMLATQQRGWEQ